MFVYKLKYVCIHTTGVVYERIRAYINKLCMCSDACHINYNRTTNRDISILIRRVRVHHTPPFVGAITT